MRCRLQGRLSIRVRSTFPSLRSVSRSLPDKGAAAALHCRQVFPAIGGASVMPPGFPPHDAPARANLRARVLPRCHQAAEIAAKHQRGARLRERRRFRRHHGVGDVRVFTEKVPPKPQQISQSCASAIDKPLTVASRARGSRRCSARASRNTNRGRSPCRRTRRGGGDLHHAGQELTSSKLRAATSRARGAISASSSNSIG